MRPTTPRLLPGLLALRRSREQVQVGLRRPLRLRDSRALRQVLDEETGQVARAADATSLAHLADQGLLLGPAASALLRPAYGTLAQRRVARDVSASVLRHGEGTHEVRTTRTAPVEVRCHGPAAEDVAEEVDALLRVVGGGGLHRDHTAGHPAEAGGTGAAGPVLVVADGEPPREMLDDLLRARRPHLLLRVVEGAVLLGPWVEPGVTACLRCEDLHRAAQDPAWPLLVAQAARRGARRRPDDVATPVEALALTAAAATAARDLLRAAEGLAPSTWSTELRWGPAGVGEHPALEAPDLGVRRLARHAACACSCWELTTPEHHDGADRGAVTVGGA